MTEQEVCIISVPHGTDEQINAIGAMLSASTLPSNIPIYVTKATVKPVTMQDVKDLHKSLAELIAKVDQK